MSIPLNRPRLALLPCLVALIVMSHATSAQAVLPPAQSQATSKALKAGVEIAAQDAQKPPLPATQRFILKARVDRTSQSTHEYDIQTTVTVGEMFYATVTTPSTPSPDQPSDTKIVTGVVMPADKGFYPVYVTMIDWATPNSNMGACMKLMLTPDKPYSWGVTASIVRDYAVVIATPDTAKP